MHFFVGQRGERFRWSSRFVLFESVWFVYIRLKHFILIKVQPKYWFKICYPLTAVDVFFLHLRTCLFLRLIIFSRLFQSFEIFSNGFSRALSRHGARMGANEKRCCFTYKSCYKSIIKLIL